MDDIVIYPGTFDPITNGHLDIIHRCSKIFPKVIVAVANSADKNPLFSLKDRVAMLKYSVDSYNNVEIKEFSNLLVDFARENGSRILVRGLRAVSDFEYEFQMGYANASLNNEIETLYFMPSLQNTFISSSVVRSILKHGGDVSHLIPKEAVKYLLEYGFVCCN